MSKGINIHMVHRDTIKTFGRTLGNFLYIGFDFDPKSKKKMIGFGFKDAELAEVISKDILVIAKNLKKLEESKNA